jgi:hypothetical protein
MVGIKFVSSYKPAKLGRQVARFLVNCEGSLPDNYGKSAEELATLMNACLHQFGSPQGHTVSDELRDV